MDKKEKNNLYMKEYLARNRERINALRRARHAAHPEIRARRREKEKEYAKEYFERTKEERMEYLKAYQKRNRDKINEWKRKHSSTEKSKAASRLREERYVASGGRKKADKRRAEHPLSTARLIARRTYEVKRRASEKQLDEFDDFVLREAVLLCRAREKRTGFQWHIDHIIPVSKGGTSEATNLQVVPARWNRQKSNKHTRRYFDVHKENF